MTKRIIVSAPTRIDFNRHYDYIAQVDPEAALHSLMQHDKPLAISQECQEWAAHTSALIPA